MIHDAKTLAVWARESGFRTEAIEKVVRLGALAQEIGAHPYLSRRLLLKGGTALNLSGDAPPRLSVDLDFNYVGSAERAVMLAERPEVERAVQHVSRALGYRVQVSAEAHAGRKFFLEYRSHAGGTERVEVDLNFLFRVPLLAPQIVALWQPGSLERPLVRIAHQFECAAGKVCATLARSAPRDLFDTARLPSLLGGDWPPDSFRRVFHALAGVLEHALHRYDLRQLRRATPVRVSSQLVPMLRGAHALDPGVLVDEAWRALAPLLVLSDSEREYTDRLQKGELRPELLFPDEPAMQAKLASHPALAWKVANARAHHGGR
ncbi:MAG: nucleotidyl transferase AbiEii/AbiGii toxin family protein [Candidatus Eisenbacteria bacterium]|nr:nucleotidyl transferase AbiEii/AbiGii toxin family protein [Candidatus Eisenbacteria bacterium]